MNHGEQPWLVDGLMQAQSDPLAQMQLTAANMARMAQMQTNKTQMATMQGFAASSGTTTQQHQAAFIDQQQHQVYDAAALAHNIDIAAMEQLLQASLPAPGVAPPPGLQPDHSQLAQDLLAEALLRVTQGITAPPAQPA